jgi:hypothetical protein
MRIKLIDAAPTILSTFDKRLAEYASDKFQRAVRMSECIQGMRQKLINLPINVNSGN